MTRPSRWLVPLLVLFATAACKTASPAPPASFTAALTNVLRYAKEEVGHDFASGGCPDCEVRVIAPQSVERYVRLDDSGFDGDRRREVEEVIRRNQGRALVITNLRGKETNDPVNIVYLPAGGPVAGTEGTAFLLTNGWPRKCGFGVFGRHGGNQFCTCNVGFCCGCGCPSCNVIGIPSVQQELDLPAPLSRLLAGSGDFASYPLDTNLVQP